jgi:hypothetical protein
MSRCDGQAILNCGRLRRQGEHVGKLAWKVGGSWRARTDISASPFGPGHLIVRLARGVVYGCPLGPRLGRSQDFRERPFLGCADIRKIMVKVRTADNAALCRCCDTLLGCSTDEGNGSRRCSTVSPKRSFKTVKSAKSQTGHSPRWCPMSHVPTEWLNDGRDKHSPSQSSARVLSLVFHNALVRAHCVVAVCRIPSSSLTPQQTCFRPTRTVGPGRGRSGHPERREQQHA